MPSPFGHALGGLAGAWLVAGPPGPRARVPRSWRRDVLLFGALGALPDIDLLIGLHRGPSHGIGAAVMVGLAAAALSTALAVRDRWRMALACAFAYGSHTLLDWLGTDTSAPAGIMALWPLSREYYESGLHLFMAVSRRYGQPEIFWRQNLLALFRELVILLSALALIWRLAPLPPRNSRA
jgi:inner membrane protein